MSSMDEAERIMERAVGRGVWFTAHDLGSSWHSLFGGREGLVSKGRLERRAIAHDDPRRSMPGGVVSFEFRLPRH